MTMPQQEQDQQGEQQQFIDTIDEKATRKAEARRTPQTGWFGLGMMGMVGWSVMVPILISIVVGAWLEANVPVGFSWRLVAFAIGVVLGCLNAWYWVEKERKRFEKEDKGIPDDAE